MGIMKNLFRLFNRTTPEKVRRAQYKRFALLHELAEAGGQKERIREILNLDSLDLISFIYDKRIELAGTELEVVFLDYYRPSQQRNIEDKVCSICLLSSINHMDYMSLKISRKKPRVLESLGASAIGGEVVSFDEPEFDSKVTVYARNFDEASVLKKEIRALILNSLYQRNLDPELRIGANFMLFEACGKKDSPTDLVALEKLMADLMSLYVHFSNKASHDDKDGPSG